MTAAGVAERGPHRSRLEHPDLPAGSFRRGELTAWLAAVAVVTQLALAPVTLLVAVLLVITGRISRWHLSWLLLPALGSAFWLTLAGLRATAHAVAAGASRLLAAELAVAVHPVRFLHPATAFAGSGRWLPHELPLLVLAGTVEAAIVLWLSAVLWPGRTWRPGLVAALRRRAGVAAMAAGHTVTADGCAIGLDYRSGRRAVVSWAQAERGVLLTGDDPAELGQVGLAIVCAALRRRKTVLVLDLAGGAARDASVPAQVARLAERIGVPVTEIRPVTEAGPVAQTGTVAQIGPVAQIGTVSVGGAVGRAIRSRSVVLVSVRQPEAAQPEAGQPEAAQPEAAQQSVSDLIAALASLRALGLRGDCLAWISGCESADGSRMQDLLALGPATGTAVLLSTTSPVRAADLAALAGVVVATGPITDILAQRLADLAVGKSAIAQAMGHESPIDAPLGASIGNWRPSAPDLADGSAIAKLAFLDIFRTQRRGSATMIAGSSNSGPVSFRIVPVDVTEVR